MKRKVDFPTTSGILGKQKKQFLYIRKSRFWAAVLCTAVLCAAVLLSGCAGGTVSGMLTVKGEKARSQSAASDAQSKSGSQAPSNSAPQAPSNSGPKVQTPSGDGPMIAIDAGHQAKGSSRREPVGPGAKEQKARVTGGTRGTSTGLYEYELNLLVAQKLAEELQNRGYSVYMVRESHDVDLSNAERAQMAYDSGAELFIRIHANGAQDSSVHGAMTICPTPDNPYIPDLYEDSRRLSDQVLTGLVESTGCKKRQVWETDTMSGINWSRLPVTIVEMGYMTNPEEDERMATDEYQQQIVEGIADGIDAYCQPVIPSE